MFNIWLFVSFESFALFVIINLVAKGLGICQS